MDDLREMLYDRYLAAAQGGDPPEPRAFLVAHDADDEELLKVLEAVYGASLASRDRAPTSTGQRRLGDFTLLDALGEGGMGIVYAARQESLDRDVAVKIIRPEYVGSASARARFHREARAVARLRHPNIVGVMQIGEVDGSPFIVMELLDGRGLDEILADAAERATIPPATVLRWMADIARALHAAHDAGIVHRDVKPSNIHVTSDGRARLLDFGLARDDRDRLAVTQGYVGSPQYMAPEQIAPGGGDVDARTDVYSLGIVLFECLTGQRPFDADSLEGTFQRILTGEPPPPRAVRPGIPSDAEVVTLKAMARVPARRYASAAAFADDLEALLEFRPISARPPTVVARVYRWSRRHQALASSLGSVLLVVLLLAAWWFADRRISASAAIDEARRLVADSRASQEAIADLETRFVHTSAMMFAKHLSQEERQLIDDLEDQIARARLARGERYARIQEMLQRAERLGADRDAVRRVRAELYLTRFIEADARDDSATADVYLNLLREHDPRGLLAEAIVGDFELSLTSQPSGAEVHAFRRVALSDMAPDGEPRLVCVPFGQPDLPVKLDAWSLRIVRGAGCLQPGDQIVEVAGQAIRGSVLVLDGRPPVRRLDRLVSIDALPVGEDYDVERLGGETLDESGSARVRRFEFERDGRRYVVEGTSLDAIGVAVAEPDDLVMMADDVPATVVSNGSARAMTLPRGLTVRTTAAPLYVCDDAIVGRTPIEQLPLPRGQYVLVFRAAGHEPCILPVGANRSRDRGLSIRMVPEGTTPPGFVRTHSRDHTLRWIMEREVTMREYAEFLNAASTRAEIAASTEPIRVPRMGEDRYFALGEDGRYHPEPEIDLDMPAFGVSWYDAKAYADWMTERARAEGDDDVELDLPSTSEWTDSCVGAHAFVFGDRFRQHWVSSNYARPKPWPEPTMRFPIDESVYGVYDLTGSVREWLSSWYREEVGLRQVKGGSWAHAGPVERFIIYGPQGEKPEFSDGSTGFRLVMRRSGAASR